MTDDLRHALRDSYQRMESLLRMLRDPKKREWIVDHLDELMAEHQAAKARSDEA